MLANDRFQSWMPTFGDKFSTILQQNCSSEYTTYLTAPGRPFHNVYCEATVSCLLSNTDERTKAVMASANVMLGLIPIILTLMGTSTAECALLSLRRPVLAALLAVGSPSKGPIRRSEYWSLVEEMVKEKEGKLILHAKSHLSRSTNMLIATAEIILAMAAVGNTISLSWRVGKSTVFNPWCSQSFGPLLWASFAVVIYFLGTATFSLRVRQYPRGGESWNGMQSLVVDGLLPCRVQKPQGLTWKVESLVFGVMAWLTSIMTIFHIIFGTFWFSSILFISAADAIGVLGRYMASAVVCKAVMTYELTGMRESTVVEKEGEARGSEHTNYLS